jgi:FdrA protein
MTARAIELLDDDAATEAIVVVAKHSGTPALAEIVKRARKPVVLARPNDDGGVEGAAARTAALFDRVLPGEAVPTPAAGRAGAIRGLFSGGTLCLEAMHTVAAAVGLDGHAFSDLGSEELTAGRAHPMIDPTLRLERLIADSRDPGVSAIVLDIVLGFGAHPDPAAVFAPAIAAAGSVRSDLTIAVSVCGTPRDPQELDRQLDQLAAAGALVTRSAAGAARVAVAAVGGTDG